MFRQYDDHLEHLAGERTSERLITQVQVVFAFKLYNLSLLDTPVPD